LPDVVARCVRVAVLIGVALIVAQTWIVDVLGLVNEGEWDQLTRSSRTAGITLFAAFVLWEAFKYVTEPYMERKAAGALPGSGDGDGTAQSATRLTTIMPLLRATVAVVLAVVAALIALEDFGVNTVPLLAGASVLGLAVSFGSQTLVRDIVSGIFYLTDDAFRVGEYIDCGRAKGTVEGFTLRSIKLRHQNGQVHTIPFGQLGQITNFSRDWITVKFNLRFARDTDVEKLRKAAKKIGADMMEMPEFKDEILAPFKIRASPTSPCSAASSSRQSPATRPRSSARRSSACSAPSPSSASSSPRKARPWSCRRCHTRRSLIQRRLSPRPSLPACSSRYRARGGYFFTRGPPNLQ
jgi:small-conductance mechanosensitive channel